MTKSFTKRLHAELDRAATHIALMADLENKYPVAACRLREEEQRLRTLEPVWFTMDFSQLESRYLAFREELEKERKAELFWDQRFFFDIDDERNDWVSAYYWESGANYDTPDREYEAWCETMVERKAKKVLRRLMKPILMAQITGEPVLPGVREPRAWEWTMNRRFPIRKDFTPRPLVPSPACYRAKPTRSMFHRMYVGGIEFLLPKHIRWVWKCDQPVNPNLPSWEELKEYLQ